METIQTPSLGSYRGLLTTALGSIGSDAAVATSTIDNQMLASDIWFRTAGGDLLLCLTYIIYLAKGCVLNEAPRTAVAGFRRRLLSAPLPLPAVPAGPAELCALLRSHAVTSKGGGEQQLRPSIGDPSPNR
jgi:hypothetical protein